MEVIATSPKEDLRIITKCAKHEMCNRVHGNGNGIGKERGLYLAFLRSMVYSDGDCHGATGSAVVAEPCTEKGSTPKSMQSM
mmetsp:Transcript_11094/g.30654  ORF Transcript_11094/g.30654 Transcript_11094/m.30654 type:complete len:82 (-) Transcript_11094:127-372(-)